jgi:LEA14-like dessication related protein
MKRKLCGPLPYTLLALLLVANMFGCASPGKRLESPRIALAHIEVQETRIFETVLKIDLRVFNTNEVPLEVKGLDCELEFNGKRFAQGVSDVAIKVPAQGTAVIPMTLYSSLVDMARGLLKAQAEEKLQYKIKGRLRLKGGFMVPSVIPFTSDGEISLKAP